MNPTRLVRARKVWLLLLLAALLGVLSLAACGTSSRGATPTATPDANAILQQASQATYTDVTFDLTITTTVLGQTVNETGSGAMTKNPPRAQETLTIPVTLNGKTTQTKIETITDSTTKTTYTRTTTNGVVGRWTKSVTNSSDFVASDLTSLDSYTNAKVIGSETLDSVAVWHLRASPGTAPAATATTAATTTTPATTKTATPTKTPTKTPTVSAASATKTAVAGATQTAIANATTVDFYIRKDNSRPVKMASHVAITGANTDAVRTFTQYDSGVTITLPRV